MPRQKSPGWAVPVRVFLIVLALAGCGVAEDAPAPKNTPAPAACAPMEVLAPQLIRLLEDGRLPGMRRLLAESLSDDQVSSVMDGALRFLKTLAPTDRDALLALARDPRLTELLPKLAPLLRSVVDLAPPALYTQARRVLRTCETGTLLSASSALLRHPALPQLFSGLGEALTLELVQQVLAERGVLNRPGFTALVCNLLIALTQPGFTVQADLIAPLEGITFLPLDVPPLSTLLNAVGELLGPDSAVLPATADLICCAEYGLSCTTIGPETPIIPGDPVFTWLLYDLFTHPSIDLPAVLDALAPLLADPTLVTVLEPVANALDGLIRDDALRRSLTDVLITLLEPSLAHAVLIDGVTLLESGAVPELLTVVDAFLNGCVQ